MYTQRNLFKPKSDCIYHFPIDLDPKDVRLDPNQSENSKYNLISLWFKEISKRYICVYFVTPRWNGLEKKKLSQTGKTTATRRKAVWQRSVSRNHGCKIEGPLVTHRIITALSYIGIQVEPLIGPSLCREILVSRTARVNFKVYKPSR